jgi:hypothetical protein
MEHIIFFTGLASTPFTVGVKNVKTKKVVEEINVSKPSGKETRKAYNKAKTELQTRHKLLLNE